MTWNYLSTAAVAEDGCSLVLVLNFDLESDLGKQYSHSSGMIETSVEAVAAVAVLMIAAAVTAVAADSVGAMIAAVEGDAAEAAAAVIVGAETAAAAVVAAVTDSSDSEIIVEVVVVVGLEAV